MLQRTAWNERKAASELKISYNALLYKIKDSGIVDPRSSAKFSPDLPPWCPAEHSGANLVP